MLNLSFCRKNFSFFACMSNIIAIFVYQNIVLYLLMKKNYTRFHAANIKARVQIRKRFRINLKSGANIVIFGNWCKGWTQKY